MKNDAEIVKDCEMAIYEAGLNRDSEKFLEVVDEDAVMVCGGYRCTGKEYADVIKLFNLVSYEIIVYETVLNTNDIIQNHYVLKTIAEEDDHQDFAGIFHVTSTWCRRDDKWKLIYNMDSRIIEQE